MRDIELALTYRPPLAAGRLLSFLAARAVPGVEHVDDATYRRSVRTPEGGGALLELTPERDESIVRLRVVGIGGAALPGALVEASRRLFDLDADPSVIDGALSADPVLTRLVAAVPGTRVPGAVDGFELAVRTIAGQQVSVAGARTALGRLVTRIGTPLAAPAGPITWLFPTPERVAAASRADLGMPGARAAAIIELARRVRDGELDLSGSADRDAVVARLSSIPGVGPWTVGYVGMRVLRDPDAFPSGDLGVRHGIAALGLPEDARSIATLTERWRPWRAYAAMHLWQSSGRPVPSSARVER